MTPAHTSAGRKEIVQAIQALGNGRYRPSQVFDDWVEMLAIAFSNIADKSQAEAREARYMTIIEKYSKKEAAEFARMSALLIAQYGDGEPIFDDVLGAIYMMCEFGNTAKGQFFTPYQLSAVMAQLNGFDEQAIKTRGFVTFCEPAVGAGGMAIAMAEAMHKAGVNYQQCLHVTAQDVDATCVHMTYVQLTMLHIPAVVILGNTLSAEEQERWYTLAHVMGGWSERLRIGRLIERFMRLDGDGQRASEAAAGPAEAPAPVPAEIAKVSSVPAHDGQLSMGF